MLKNYRREVLVTLYGIALLALIVASVVFIWSQYQRGNYEYQKYQQRTYTDLRQTADKIASQCAIANVPASIVSQCLAEQIESREHQAASNKDLKAQQDMAFWGFWMFAASAGGLAVSMFGLILLFVSLRQTRTAINDTREIGEAQTRAYLSVTGGTYSLWGNNLVLEPAILNSGQSPNKGGIVKVCVECAVRRPERGNVAWERVISHELITPINNITANSTSVVSVHYSSEDGIDDYIFENWSVKFHVRGTIHWRDVFGEENSESFLLRSVSDSDHIKGSPSDDAPDERGNLVIVSRGSNSIS